MMAELKPPKPRAPTSTLCMCLLRASLGTQSSGQLASARVNPIVGRMVSVLQSKQGAGNIDR